MKHWQKVLPPASYIDVDVNLIAEGDHSAIKSLVDFCGLEWEDEMLNELSLDKSKKSPFEKWKPYRSHLTEFAKLSDL